MREPIEDAPAVYFIEPTNETIGQVILDMKKNLYHSYYFNFAGRISRVLLEDLAAEVASANLQSAVRLVYDQYLEFICLEKNFFTLNHSNSLLNIFGPHSDASTIDKLCDRITSSLFSVAVTTGTNF